MMKQQIRTQEHAFSLSEGHDPAHSRISKWKQDDLYRETDSLDHGSQHWGGSNKVSID